MKHSAIDASISQARHSSMEAADRIRNTPRQCEQANIVSVVQQNCLPEQEMTSESESVRNIQTGSANSNIKLPGTSVRHMQQRSKSMTSDSKKEADVKKEPVSNNAQSRVSDMNENGEPEVKYPALRRSYSTTAISSNKENTSIPLERARYLSLQVPKMQMTNPFRYQKCR